MKTPKLNAKAKKTRDQYLENYSRKLEPLLKARDEFLPWWLIPTHKTTY